MVMRRKEESTGLLSLRMSFDASDICLGEIVAFEEKGYTGVLCYGVGHAIPVIQTRRVASSAESIKRDACYGGVLRREGYKLDVPPKKKSVENKRGWKSRFAAQDQMRFEQRRCSEQTVIAADASEYVLRIGFIECDGN